MYEDLILQYDSLVAEYKKIVSDGFCKAGNHPKLAY